MIYLDSAATTLQKPRAVARAAGRAVRSLSSPGRGGYPSSMAAADAAFECREKAALLFNVKNPENVVITSSATHGLNIAIRDLASRGGRALISGYEHNAVTRPLAAAGTSLSVAVSELFEPEMALHAFESRLSRDVSMAVINHVSNVFGYILPIERIVRVCRERGVPVIIDASQSAGVAAIDFEALGADFIAMPGHKGLYGPQGTGLLLCSRVPEGIMQGGTGGNSISQEMPGFLPDRLEPGTHNMPGIAGLIAGLDFVLHRGTERIMSHESALAQYASDGLAAIEGVRVFRSEYSCFQAGVVSFIVSGIACETVGSELASRGIAVRAGLHCAPLAHRTAETISTGTVRASFSVFNTKGDVRELIRVVRDIAEGANC